jgi:hypothetical protein
MKRRDESTGAFEQALTKDADTAAGWTGKAVALFLLGRWSEVRAAMRHATERSG